MKRSPLILVLGVCTPLLLGGCAAALVGAGAAAGVGGVAVAQDRRSAGTMLDDEIIEDKALDALYSDHELWNKAHINVTSYDHIVLLTGEAPTPELKAQAAALVQPIPKVREVHNEIEVSAPSSLLTRSSDTWITSKVKSSLIASNDVSANHVKVVTEDGVVYLMGLVTPAEAKAATDIARQVGGVQRVVTLFEYVNS